MSKQGIDGFGAKVAATAELGQQANKLYQQLGEDLKKAHVDYFQRVVDLGKKSGFEFTPAEAAQQFEKGLSELSDDALDKVAGGGTMTFASRSLGTVTPDTAQPLVGMQPSLRVNLPGLIGNRPLVEGT